jgi:hypothetical protein
MTATFEVKNFDRFQHYKDRSPPWIKLYNELLDDYEFARLQDASKLHLILIWLLASRSDNKLPFDSEWVARRINATVPVDLEALADAGFLVVHQPRSKPLARRKHIARPETEREGETEERERQKETPSSVSDFDKFWQRYPHKIGKGAAKKAFKKANVPLDTIFAGLARYTATKPRDRPWCNPATWLNQERWQDQPADYSVKNGNGYAPTTPEEDAARYRRMLEHERATGEWKFKTPKSEIPPNIVAEFQEELVLTGENDERP